MSASLPVPPGNTEAGRPPSRGPAGQASCADRGLPDRGLCAPVPPALHDDAALPGAGSRAPRMPGGTSPGPSAPPAGGHRDPPGLARRHKGPTVAENLQGAKKGVRACPDTSSGDESPAWRDSCAAPSPAAGPPSGGGREDSPSAPDPGLPPPYARAPHDRSPPPGAVLCDVCGEELLDSDAIDCHIELHGPVHDVPDDPLPCPDADPSDPPPDPAYPFPCAVCRAKYKTRRGLDAHMDRLGHHPPLDDVLPKIIGIPSGAPTQALLNLLVATLRMLTSQLPPTEALSRLLGICRVMEGSGRLPPADMLLRKGLLGRAWEAIQSEAAPHSHVPEPSGVERARIVRELHPEPPEVVLPGVQPVVGPAPRVTGQALLRELRAMRAVAAGPSGLGRQHLLYLCERGCAADLFADALRQLYGSRDWGKLGALSEFRLKLIPKQGGKWRPIAVQETLLVAFHRLILKQTPPLRKLPSWQLAFAPLAQARAIRRAEELKRDCHLLTVDVKNAFNSVPHPVLLFSLHRARVPTSTVGYVESFLRARHAADLPAVPAGVPQGDPLSMAMFCHALTWPVESFLAQYEVLAYADDMILASSPSVPASTVREDAHAALARVGLSVTIEKCASTQEGGISFMGTRIIRDSPYNLAECATRSLYESLRTLRAADVSRHSKIRLLSYCIVPSVNYGPLVDAYPGPQSYQEVDALVIAELGALLGIPDKLARALALAPRSAHGVGLVLPHHYHADMQRQARAMQAGTFRELRKAQLASTAPLHTFLPLALLRGPPLSDDQVLFIGDCLAGRYQKTPPMGVCRHCKQPMLGRHHLVCKAINTLHVARHTRVMEALLAATRGKTSRIVKNPALPIDHLQPDFVIDDGFGDLVITVPWRVDRSYSLKLTKYLPLLQRGRAAFFLPIVVGGDGTLHPATASGLARVGVDLLRFRLETAQILLWHHAQTALAYAKLSTDGSLPRPEARPGCSATPHEQHRARTVGDIPTPRLQTPRSPSVEVVDEPPGAPRPRAGTPRVWQTGHAAPVGPYADEDDPLSLACAGAPEDLAEFRRSRGPSPPPLSQALQDEPSSTQDKEPPPKQLPPIFKLVGTRVETPRKDVFYPFKKIGPPAPVPAQPGKD